MVKTVSRVGSSKKTTKRTIQKKRQIMGGTAVGGIRSLGPVIREHFNQVAPAGIVPQLMGAKRELSRGGVIVPSGARNAKGSTSKTRKKRR